MVTLPETRLMGERSGVGAGRRGWKILFQTLVLKEHRDFHVEMPVRWSGKWGQSSREKARWGI